jgi:acyl-CoA synthetase (AMP-forming)/AMP-acid ligase II
MEAMTLAHLLPDRTSTEPAIVDEATAVTISYRALSDQVEHLAQQLCGAGLDRGAGVALVLPNGVESLVVPLALARAGLITVPLNPAYTASELRSLITRVGARAIVAGNRNVMLADIATALGLPIWASSVDRTGDVSLAGIRSSPSRASAAEPSAGDVALYLHTSGTEGRPKVVPLTHANVLLSARQIAAHYALTPADRTLVVLPLFHGHGLIGAALATLASGGAVIVPSRFSASRFWASFVKHRATWYTAVPTIHQILLARADADGAPRSGARFIRSCSSALPESVFAELERRFGAPVLEAYGLTEASHQVASNPLPPRMRKAGTVGFGTGVQIAIFDADGHTLPAHRAGEVVVRGPSVMQAYRDNAAASAAAFVDGWLRTGDVGALDENGYLTLTGRIKEMINRGGEKISPTEIEAALLAHPAVAEAAAFAVPDAKYGEAVGAAVVLEGDADPDELRSFSRERLADFMVPSVIRIVPALPRNAMGKVERRALTEWMRSQVEPIGVPRGSRI